MRIFSFLSLAAVLLCGCSTTVVRDAPLPVRVADGAIIDSTPLVEALLARKGTTVQAVSGTWKENAFAAEVVMTDFPSTNTAAVAVSPLFKEIPSASQTSA